MVFEAHVDNEASARSVFVATLGGDEGEPRRSKLVDGLELSAPSVDACIDERVRLVGFSAGDPGYADVFVAKVAT